MARGIPDPDASRTSDEKIPSAVNFEAVRNAFAFAAKFYSKHEAIGSCFAWPKIVDTNVPLLDVVPIEALPVRITMTVPDAPNIIQELVRHHEKDVLIGAGTVTTADSAAKCIDAGAQFLVSPGLAISVLQVAGKHGILAIPGALTPTEVMEAIEAGVEVIKISPCSSVGGPKHLKALKAPFPNAQFIPTGGVNLSNAAEYFAAGAFALGVGANLVDLAALRENNPGKIVAGARALVNAVRLARTARS